ncbi:hypothetical protein GCM10010174_18560 [Kutzneria viridogrisea]|uniref:Uncharacterized protein n=2 Tax=Kutzneria TaxID=43356 RepID=W5WEF1_9PSEU|nr:hypothetical protein [Kutzneria albida]AHH99568.1 hypothetical protein KALB_6208 [Kutzneria albida DSM 43870]MBA8922877.1 hypothetical protein [Kutzneria viridogrisea]
MTQPDSTEFSATPQRAIAAKGLTLDRIVHRPHERGHALSADTLSYWTTGRGQSERPRGLHWDRTR